MTVALEGSEELKRDDPAGDYHYCADEDNIKCGLATRNAEDAPVE